MDEEALEATIAEMVKRSMALTEELSKHLAGAPRACQGAALADLLGIWIAGHHLNGDEFMLRLLDNHMTMVRLGIPMQVERLKGKRLDG